jgi:transaldolase
VKGVLPTDGGDADQVLAEFARAGIDEAQLAAQLQREGAAAFEKSWNDLLGCIVSKSVELK